MIVSLIIKLSPDWLSGAVLSCDWLALGVNVESAANADVDFCTKMASLTGAALTSRSGSSSPSKKRAEMAQRRSRLVHSNMFLLVSLAAVLHCAAADGKTLVLLDNLNIRDTHSIFFRSLAGQSETLCSCINTVLCALIVYPLCYKHVSDRG